jgi:hypothetical protein
MTVVTTHPTFSVSLIEDKTEGLSFHTIEVIEAEQQAVLNTLKKHDFQDAFKKNCRSAGNGADKRKGSKSKVSF